MRHSATRVTREYVTTASLEAFKVEFFTAGMYAREQNLTSQCAAQTLRECGLKPITEKIGIRKIYRRRDALATGSFCDHHDLPCTE
ncbi:hypothetical protein SAMN02746000_03086 [Paracoccus sp. J56]|nr:hypothetical protein SAMN02746000_03086 [Paracoccus sp. J56]